MAITTTSREVEAAVSVASTGATAPRDTPKRHRRRRVGAATGLLFVLPGFALFVVAILYPIARAVQMSLYQWQILPGAISTFLGLDNYTRALRDPQFWLSLGNSGIYMVFTVPPQIVLGLLIAILLRRKSPSQPVFRVLFYIPVITSWVVVSLLFKYLFADNGLVNFTLHDFLHLMSDDTSWLSGRWTALVAICALGVWKGIGWSMMIFLAALQGVPQSLEEAAMVDGAGRWRRFTTVTLPAIWPAAAFVTVMLVIGGFNVFTSVLVMTGGGPGGQTEVLLTYMYNQAFKYLDFGYGSAIAVLLAVFVLLLSVVQLRVFRTESVEVVG